MPNCFEAARVHPQAFRDGGLGSPEPVPLRQPILSQLRMGRTKSGMTGSTSRYDVGKLWVQQDTETGIGRRADSIFDSSDESATSGLYVGLRCG
jgi:hypothetical protein